jgi:hypothetical protein
MPPPLSERVAVAETEIKALTNTITDLKKTIEKLVVDVRKLQDTYQWAIGVAFGAGVVLTIFSSYLKKQLGL